MRIAIVGGSAAGLFAALLLARAGHEAVVLERDSLELAPDVETAAAAAFRPSAPQIVQPHIIMARCRELLIERLPDVYQGLLDAGVAEAPLWTQMPGTLSDTAARPGDEHLIPVMTRRSTVDWVLQRAAAAEPRVEVRCGVKVTGLLAIAGLVAFPGRRPVPARPPHVTGIRTHRGDLPAGLVVDATGRRSPVDDWLAQIGAKPTATWFAECGIAYYSRHYRIRQAVNLPGLPVTRTVIALDEFLAGKWGADNGAGQLAVAPLAADRRYRGKLVRQGDRLLSPAARGVSGAGPHTSPAPARRTTSSSRPARSTGPAQLTAVAPRWRPDEIRVESAPHASDARSRRSRRR